MAKKKKKASKKARPARKSGRTLNVVSTADLHAELNRRQGQASKLAARHKALLKEIAEVESMLAAFGVTSGSRRAGKVRKRPKNDSNLEVALAKVLKGKTMGVTEVAEAVQAAGYRTTSPNFRTIVNQTLIRSALIKKLSRGQYTAA